MRSRGIPAESDALGLRNDTGVGVNALDDGDGEGAAFACVESCCSSASELSPRTSSPTAAMQQLRIVHVRVWHGATENGA
jgi:hypothetical protein